VAADKKLEFMQREWISGCISGDSNRREKHMKRKIIFALLTVFYLTVIIFSSCTSVKSVRDDILINNSQKDQMEENLKDLERTIVPLEAAGGTQARRMQNDLALVRKMLGDMEKDALVDNDYSAKLFAWSGRLAILEGRYSEAQRQYRQSAALSAGNIPSIILGIRLEGDPEKRLELIERELAISGGQSSASGYGELMIERGRSLFEMNRYTEATGAFDAAFASGLDGVYRESYEKDRNLGWELRNASGASGGTMDMLVQDTVNWNDLIAITRNETQLLRFLTAGRNVSEAELFTRLTERAFIPYSQNVTLNEWPRTRPAATEIVTRAGAAWFLWHLYAEARADRGLLSRYSARYATGANPRSPIADIPPLSPFFDSILGCVETELLSLPDGRNFRPTQFIRGAELLTVLKKIDN
jgi:tetratricopeptide (TPR) repeat protein